MGAATGLYAWRFEPHWVEVTEVPMRLPGLHPALVGKTLIQLSDVHVGPEVDFEYQRDCIAKVNALAPDIVVTTGDLMSCHDTEQIQATVDLFSGLKIPPLGAYAAMGNHDYGLRWRRHHVANQLDEGLSRLGFQVLRNRFVKIQNLHLVGLDDMWSPNFDTAVLQQVAQAGPVVTLCHNPDGSEKPGWDGVDGWTLAGHTHGGQVKPPFLPPPRLPVRNKRFTAGTFDMPGGRTLYINRGLGHLIRVRFNVRPEITRFTLLRA